MLPSVFSRYLGVLRMTLVASLITGCTVLPIFEESLLETAQLGDAESQFRVAEIYREAYYDSVFGSFTLWKEAADWYALAAEQGHAGAQYYLSVYYFTFGNHYSESLYWVRKAAMAGVAEAQVSLGLHHAQGWGTPQDLVQAYMWIALGDEGGMSEPIDMVARLDWFVSRAEPTGEQVAEARRLKDEHTRIYGRSRSVLVYP